MAMGPFVLSAVVVVVVGPWLGGNEPAQPDVAEILQRIRSLSPPEREPWVQQLALAGPDALAATRAARDSLPEGDLKKSLSRAATWQLARKVAPALLEKFETALTFAGQYLFLLEEGPELVGALVALIDDEATDIRIRLSACRALADAVDERLDRPEGSLPPPSGERKDRLLARLRRLYHDILLAPVLRDQIGILLAILGDMQAVDSDIQRLLRLAASEQELESVRSHLRLANLYYRIRDYEKAVRSYDKILSFYERVLELYRLRKLPPESIESLSKELALEYYNAACSNALNHDVETAMSLLRKAVEIDPIHVGNLQEDGDLENIRKSPGYEKFREELLRIQLESD